MSDAVKSFGTAFVLTTIVRRRDGDYQWTRRPGLHRGSAMGAPDPGAAALIQATRQGRVPLRLPERVDEEGVTYRTNQDHTLAGLLLGTGAGAGEPVTEVERIVADTLLETGASLARLHALPLPQTGLPSPEGPRRLLAWLRSGQGPGGAPELHPRAAEILGGDRMAAVAAWCAPAAGPGALLHGAPSMGILLPMLPGRDGCLLTGENLSAGPPESDLGWLIGELVEFRETNRRFGALRDVDYDLLIGRVLDGYAAAVDHAAVGRAAAVRFLSHVYDFAAFVRWKDVLVDYLKLVADVIDAAGEGRLLRSADRARRP
ncbi:hypothetical protein [Acrocarpospora catenulata]|uniref:hypothetical protein n=1 Tax=Acrocarpospora catenulata TaxID=2836182 RepID=UPI001BDB672A|nr:hypothetical protein [Acrocarpospora catenulata]